MIVKLKSGGWRNIPSDYAVSPDPENRYGFYKVGNKIERFVLLEHKKGQKRYATQIQDNAVWKFINEIGNLELDYESMEGLKQYMAILTSLVPFDDYGYLSTMNLMTYGVDKIKELDDRERFVTRLELVEKQLELIKKRVTDPDLQDELSNIISVMDADSCGDTDGDDTPME